jgi:conserved oligomeric Golgi complex subunit 2
VIWLGRICAAEARIAAGLADDDASKNTASAAIADARSEMRVSLQDLEDSLTTSAAHLCCEVLRGVSGVKQVLATYRMTDRPAPTEPSVYVDGSLAALGCFAFEAGVPKGLSSETTGRWVRASLGIICECYAHLCLDVLESARKTAAGLGLIKTRRKKPTGMSDAAAPLSDLDKISAQLHLDVQHFPLRNDVLPRV